MEDHVRVMRWPESMVDGLAESVAMGVWVLQETGLLAPLLQERPLTGSLAEPPPPPDGLLVQPPVQPVQAPPTYPWPSGHCEQEGGLLAPLAQARVMAVHAPQLLFSFDSETVPEPPEEFLSAQART